MKLDRLLAITMLLLNRTRVSATELANRFEVSLRTIYRDMESINQAGIPIVSYAGAEGGYEIMSGYRLDKQVLSLDDFSAICSALRGVRPLAGHTDIDSLLDRIGAILPGHASAEQTSLLDMDLASSGKERTIIRVLHQAAKEQQLARLRYLDGRGEESERKIEPMGVFLKGFVWYVYGYCLKRTDFRVFRLSRMLQVELLQETFQRRNYSLRDVEREFMRKADFERVRAELRFQPAVKTRVWDEFSLSEITMEADGAITVSAGFSSVEKAVQRILSYGSQVEVAGPPELIEELKAHIQALRGLYGL